MATEERQWTEAERWFRERYSATPERRSRSRTLSGEPIRPLYGPEDVGPFEDAIGVPGRVSVHARRVPDHVPRAGCGRCASSRASARPRRPTSASATCSTTARPACQHGVRHAVADGPRLRPPAVARRGRPRGRRRSTRSTTCRRCSHGIDLGEVTVSMTINAPAAIMHGLLRRRGRGARASPPTSSAARSRPTSSRSTSPRRSGASRSTRRCACSAT